MRYTVFVSLILWSINISFAQILPTGVEVKKGVEIPNHGKNQVSTFVGPTEMGVVAYGRSKNSLTFFAYADDLTTRLASDNELKLENVDLKFEAVVKTNNGIFVFSSNYDESIYKSTLYRQKLDLLTLKLSAPEIMQFKTTDEEIGSADFIIEVSENGELLMIDVSTWVEKDKNENKVEVFDVYVYSSGFDVVWSTEEIQITNDESKMSRSRFQVSNSGTVVMLASASSITGDVTIKINDINDFLNILSLSQHFLVTITENKDPVLFEIKMEEYRILSLDYTISTDGKINVVGVYKGKESKEQGFYYALINDETGEFEAENLSVFGDMKGVLNSNSHYKDPQVAAALKLTRNLRPKFSINKIVSDEYGTTMIGESIYRDYTTETFYYYGIAVVRFDKEGDILWRQGIPKIQYGNYKTEKQCSYGMIQSGSKLAFVFKFLPINKTDGNLEGKSWNAKKPSDIYLAQVDDGGEVTIDLIIESSKDPIWTPRFYFQTGAESTIIVGKSGFGTKLIEIKVSDD
jgi:hypothetical protein